MNEDNNNNGIDTEDENFQQFNQELRGKLSSKLFNALSDLRQNVARTMSDRVNGILPKGDDE